MDKYERTLADVLLPDGMNLNQELVKQGWCWWYRKHAPGDTVLEGLETEARDARRGLWADPHPVPPWVCRKLGHVNTLAKPAADGSRLTWTVRPGKQDPSLWRSEARAR